MTARVEIPAATRAAISDEYRSGTSIERCAAKFGLSYSTARKVIHAECDVRGNKMERWQWEEAEADYVMGADLHALAERYAGYGCTYDALRHHMVLRGLLPWYEKRERKLRRGA